jgi:hypothetical protein
MAEALESFLNLFLFIGAFIVVFTVANYWGMRR